MFEKKRCGNCKDKVKDEWKYCPACGYILLEESKPFSIFGDVEKELERIDKTFKTDSRFPRFKFPVKGGGVSIRITSGTGMQPKVEVRTSGEYKKLGPDIRTKLGVREPVREVEEKPKEVKMPKITEEPETKIHRIGNKQTITVNLPDVKEEDVQIKQLEQSIEIRAYAGDKAYFKLIPVPANAYIGKEFKDGILKIEVVR